MPETFLHLILVTGILLINLWAVCVFVAVMKGGTTGIKERYSARIKTLIPLRCIKATS